MSKLRLYTDDMLNGKSNRELRLMKDNVSTSNVLTKEEQAKNIEILNYKITGSLDTSAKAMMEIEASKPDDIM